MFKTIEVTIFLIRWCSLFGYPEHQLLAQSAGNLQFSRDLSVTSDIGFCQTMKAACHKLMLRRCIPAPSLQVEEAAGVVGRRLGRMK